MRAPAAGARRTRAAGGRRRVQRLALAACLLGAGCSSGPDFKPPAPPVVADAARPYTEAPLPAATASAAVPSGAAQRFVLGADVPAQWWQLFGSPALDALVRSALEHSPTLAAAQAALSQAEELYAADAGARLVPSVGGQLGVTRQRQSQAASNVAGGVEFTLYNASVGVSYTVDAFGGVRRELEALEANVDLQRYQVEAAALALSANVVTAAIQEASLRAQLEATQEILATQQRSLAIVERQSALGAVAQQAVLAQRTQIAQTRSTLPPLDKALAQTRQQLAVYAGRLPGDAGLPEFRLDALTLPQALPVSLPSELVRQRPDIRAGEALLHSASAQVGVAAAAQYPQITLSGSVGSQALKLDKLFGGPAAAWSLGAGLVAPLIDGGAARARRRAAEAVYRQTLAQYQQTVLGAFLNVANVLRALDSDAQALARQAEAAELARQSLELARQQHRAGAVSTLVLLDAERSVQATRIALVQAEAARHADTAALFQALGGGWWQRDPLPASTGPQAFAPEATAVPAATTASAASAQTH